MSRNQEIANLLFDVAEGLQAKGERGFRVMAYLRAAQRIARMPEDVEVLCEMGRLHDIEGVGESIGAKVEEYLRSGTLGYLRQVRGKIPRPVKSLMAVKGIGSERARTIWQILDVATLDELARAATAHRLCRLPGIGETLEAEFLSELERMGIVGPKVRRRSVQLPLFPSPVPVSCRTNSLARTEPSTCTVRSVGLRLADRVGHHDRRINIAACPPGHRKLPPLDGGRRLPVAAGHE